LLGSEHSLQSHLACISSLAPENIADIFPIDRIGRYVLLV